jgi:hypothetical protein
MMIMNDDEYPRVREGGALGSSCVMGGYERAGYVRREVVWHAESIVICKSAPPGPAGREMGTCSAVTGKVKKYRKKVKENNPSYS